MKSDIQQIWQEIFSDLSTKIVLWQLCAILASLLLAWLINRNLRIYFLKTLQSHQNQVESKLAIGSINRALFPSIAFILVWVAKTILKEWQHVGVLVLASRLLLAMAVIRLIIYAIRYIFAPSGWLKTLESVFSWFVWSLLALHLTGYLPMLTQALQDIEFSIGKNQVNLLVLIQGIFTVLVTLIIALWLSAMIENKLMRAEQISVNFRVVLTKLVRIVLLFFAILIALSAVGLDITMLSVFSGALGVGLGLGLQKVASNYVSGFIILLDKSMHIGDIITVDKHYGIIQDMRSRYTVLGKLDGTSVIIPNETLITTAIVNHSLTEHRARVQVQVAVAFEGDLPKALNLMKTAAEAQPRVLVEPAPDAQIKGFGEFGVELALVVWVADPERGVGALQSEIYMKIWKAFNENSIAFRKMDKITD